MSRELKKEKQRRKRVEEERNQILQRFNADQVKLKQMEEDRGLHAAELSAWKQALQLTFTVSSGLLQLAALNRHRFSLPSGCSSEDVKRASKELRPGLIGLKKTTRRVPMMDLQPAALSGRRMNLSLV